MRHLRRVHEGRRLGGSSISTPATSRSPTPTKDIGSFLTARFTISSSCAPSCKDAAIGSRRRPTPRRSWRSTRRWARPASRSCAACSLLRSGTSPASGYSWRETASARSRSCTPTSLIFSLSPPSCAACSSGRGSHATLIRELSMSSCRFSTFPRRKPSIAASRSSRPGTRSSTKTAARRLRQPDALRRL